LEKPSKFWILPVIRHMFPEEHPQALPEEGVIEATLAGPPHTAATAAVITATISSSSSDGTDAAGTTGTGTGWAEAADESSCPDGLSCTAHIFFMIAVTLTPMITRNTRLTATIAISSQKNSIA
jgi:hypothetical protein